MLVVIGFVVLLCFGCVDWEGLNDFRCLFYDVECDYDWL